MDAMEQIQVDHFLSMERSEAKPMIAVPCDHIPRFSFFLGCDSDVCVASLPSPRRAFSPALSVPELGLVDTFGVLALWIGRLG